MRFSREPHEAQTIFQHHRKPASHAGIRRSRGDGRLAGQLEPRERMARGKTGYFDDDISQPISFGAKMARTKKHGSVSRGGMRQRER